MAYKKIQIVLALDGQDEFRQGISNANKEAQNLQSQLSKLSSEYEGSANSLEYLTKKQELLTQQEEQYKKKLETSKKALEQAQSTQKKAAERYEELTEEVEDAKEALQKMADAGEEGTKEYQKQAKEVENLEKALNRQGTQCTKCEGVISDYSKKVNTAETQVNKANSELQKNETYLNEAKNATDKCATSIDKFGNETTSATKTVTSFGDKMVTAFVNSAVSNGMDLLKDGLRELADVEKEVVEVGSEFEAAMSEVEAISGATGDELESLTEKAKELGESTKYTASEAAEAFSYMALAGWDTQEMLEGIDGVLNLAAAADMDLAEASDIVTDYLTAFGLAASDSAEFVDMMAYAMANSNTTVEDLGEAYKNCAATASSMGYSAEEVTAVLATMANAGVKGGEAGTALNTIMTRLATNTKSCGDALAEYGVEIYDSEGNMNSLSDILEGMSGIWETLTDEEQANLAKTIAGTNQYSALQTVMSGLSEEAEESGKSFSDYAEALEDCTGTAEEMAETMQDNLQGDLTKLNSALQGLGIEAYEYINGPLRSVVQGVTSIISGITDVISPEQDALESLVSAAEEADSAVSASISNRATSIASAEQEAAQIEVLGTRLMELNEIEDKTAAQKAEMEQIVEQLSTSIPELAEAYDEETGSLSLTNDELQEYIDAQKESVIQQALLAANEDLINSLVEAQTQYDKLGKQITELSEQNDIYDSQIAEIAELEQAYTEGTISQEEYQNGLMGIALQYEEMLSTGEISMNTLGKDLQELKEANSETVTELTENQAEYQKTIDEGTELINENAESAEKLASSLLAASDAADEAADSNEDYADSGEDATDKSDELIVSMEDVAAAATGDIDAIEGLNETLGIEAEAAEDAADSTEELESALDDAATAAEKSAEAQETAFNNIYNAYTSTFESIAEDLKNKIDLTSKFDGGEDITTETMNENLDSYIEGLQTYQENLEKVRSMVDESGNQIFSDDVLAEIESNGTDMASMLEHIVQTYENEGEYGVEQIKGINDKWQEALDMSEEIARAGAANQTAYELAMGELGSTDVDFSSLQDAIDEAVEAAGEGWSGLTEETQAALQESVDLAKSMGVQIPNGLTDAIASGETSAEQAVEQLNASIQGTLEGLLLVAQNSGADVSDELASSITAGTADAQSAMTELMNAISDSADGDGSVASAVGSEVDGAVETISEKTEELEESGSGITDSIAAGITENEETLTDAVDEVVSAGAEAAASENHITEYEEAGKALADAVAGGIEGDTETAEEAAAEFSKALAETMAGVLLESDILSQFEDAGFQAVLAYNSEFSAADASDDAAAQAQILAKAASDALAKETSGFEDAGFKAVFTYNSEFSAADALDDAAAQAQLLAQAVSDALNDADKSGIEGAGADVEDAYATAMATSSMLSDTRGQAQKLASAALEGVKYNQSGFKTAGYNMSAGVATGIASGQSQAIAAAKNMAAAALAAAKAELDIHSPSGKFREDVGVQIGKGLAFGISDSASLAGDAADEMSALVYERATGWLTSYKAAQEVTLEDEQYFWQEITRYCQEGSTAYSAALDNYNSALAQSIKNSVSTTTTSGSGSNETTVAKDTEDYYSDVFDAAQDYMDKLETISDVSLDEQLSYWKAVQSQLQSGTDAWYDAQKEINSITEDYQSSIVSAAETAMEHMQILNDVPLDEQIAYWKNIRSQLEQYSDEWYEVTETIKNLREKANSEILSDAKDTLEHMEILGNSLTLDEQIEYWKNVRSQLKKYSDEWYKVKETIKDLKEEANSDILTSAETTLSRIEALNGSLSLDEEITYWKNVRSQLEKYSDEWYEVTETIKELRRSRYDEMYSAAEEYAENMDTLDSWSLSEELAYWQAVQKAVKKGSDAWYSAQSQINSIKSSIGTVSNMSSLLSAYTTYYDLSEKAEMQYWETVRQQYEEGTDERLEADQNYLEAKEAYYDRLEELEEDYADAVEEIEENLTNNIESLTDSYNDSLQSRIDTIKDAYGLFDEFTSESSDGKTLLFNLQSQAAGYEAWSDALDALEERDILSDDLLQELTEMGPEELAAIYALSDLTDEELTAYQEAYDRKMEAATKQAEEDTADLKEELEQQTAELTAQAEQDKADLLAEYESNTASVNETISAELLTLAESTKTIAEDQTTALVNAISGGVSEIKAVMDASDAAASEAASTGTSVANSAVSSSSSGSSSASSDAILEAIYSGKTVTTLTSAQREKHHDLYLYLVDNYGHGGNNNVYKQLASLLGVSIAGDSVTPDEKDDILKKLKKKGYKSGGRNLEDELVWMDEELASKGPELVVSRSDNALLTRIPAGSDIIDANTTSNLLRLGEINPDDLMSVLTRQQAAAAESLNSLNVMENSQLNDLAGTGAAANVQIPDFGRMVTMMENMQSLMEEFLPHIADKQGIYIDSEKLVGSTADETSRSMAMRTRRKRG